jgi:hypothetical protein
MKHEVIGKTVHNRDIPVLTITDPSVADGGKKVVWLMARQHAWETGTSWVADGAVRFLLSNEAEAARIKRSTVFKVIPLFDVDGAVEGAVRFNLNGYDNNRNWDIADAKLMPEISSIRKALLGRFRPSDQRVSGDAQHRVQRLCGRPDRGSEDQTECRRSGNPPSRVDQLL